MMSAILLSIKGFFSTVADTTSDISQTKRTSIEDTPAVQSIPSKKSCHSDVK